MECLSSFVELICDQHCFEHKKKMNRVIVLQRGREKEVKLSNNVAVVLAGASFSPYEALSSPHIGKSLLMVAVDLKVLALMEEKKKLLPEQKSCAYIQVHPGFIMWLERRRSQLSHSETFTQKIRKIRPENKPGIHIFAK